MQWSLRHLLLGGLALSSVACGHSEEEWQAQLDKYNQLATKNQSVEDELAAAKAKAKSLEDELEAMGFKLHEEGAEKQKLMSALDEYKKRAAALERIKARFENLRKKLEELTKLGLNIDIRKNRMVISLPGDVLFASGKDKLEKKGIEILGKVAKVIREDEDLAKRTYQVAGHTDNQKIESIVTKKKFQDNWGLSLMRARTVLLYLIQPVDDEKSPGGGLDSKLWSASGYGDTDPISNNAGKQGRQKNRRVELIMMPNVEEMLDLKSLASDPTAEDKGDNNDDALPKESAAGPNDPSDAPVPPPPAKKS